MTTLSNDTSASVLHAKTRLDAAMARLERAIESRADRFGAQDGVTGGLDQARAEIGRMKETNKLVSARLDAAIGRVRVLLDE